MKVANENVPNFFTNCVEDWWPVFPFGLEHLITFPSFLYCQDVSNLVHDVNMIFEDPDAQNKIVTPSEALEFAVADRPHVIEPTGVNTNILNEKREYKRQVR